VIGDPGRLRQIVVHLIGNAIKCTDQGEVVMRVTVEWQTQHEVGPHFAATDTGIGIPPARQPLLCNSFTLADSSPPRRADLTPPSVGPESLPGLAVLVVDDGATSRGILAEQCRSRGMRPTVVDGGPAALLARRRAVAG
jgi:hypothetical protein